MVLRNKKCLSYDKDEFLCFGAHSALRLITMRYGDLEQKHAASDNFEAWCFGTDNTLFLIIIRPSDFE